MCLYSADMVWLPALFARPHSAERNRQSAAASRERKKHHIKELETRAARLSEEVARLQVAEHERVRARVVAEERLQRENEALKHEVSFMAPLVCTMSLRVCHVHMAVGNSEQEHCVGGASVACTLHCRGPVRCCSVSYPPNAFRSVPSLFSFCASPQLLLPSSPNDTAVGSHAPSACVVLGLCSLPVVRVDGQLVGTDRRSVDRPPDGWALGCGRLCPPWWGLGWACWEPIFDDSARPTTASPAIRRWWARMNRVL